MKSIILLFILIAFGRCTNSSYKNAGSIELITEKARQDSIFRNLILLTNNSIPEPARNDSLAFLVLPVQASCPACRKKTIDSIAKHRSGLLPNRFIILSANGGRKTINSFFREENTELPEIENHLFLDSSNTAFRYDLYSDKPTIYYTYNQKAYKKVAAIPTTVRDDLREFFSGFRHDQQKN